MILESHAHYSDEQFDADRHELLSSLQANGIDVVVNMSASMETAKQTIELIETYPFMYGAIGVHPEDINELTEEKFERLSQMATNEKVVAIGEIGLDYYWDITNKEVQKKWFVAQMRLARKLKLPIVVHSRDAAQDTLDIMKAEKASELGGVIHCFSYSVEMAKEYLDMGFYLGIGGVITFSNAKKLKEVVEAIPLDRILLETDAPYLSPAPNRGKRNSSLNLPFIAQAIADIKGVSYEEVVETTTQNGKKMFQMEKGTL